MDAERAWAGPSEEDPTYRLLVDCNQLAVDIDNEIAIVHNFMRDKYRWPAATLPVCMLHQLCREWFSVLAASAFSTLMAWIVMVKGEDRGCDCHHCCHFCKWVA